MVTMGMPFRQKVFTALAIPGIAGLIGAKMLYLHWALGHGGDKQRILNANRRSFGSLPRASQRSVLYYKRGQLQDLQNIYAQGYQPRQHSFGARRSRFF